MPKPHVLIIVENLPVPRDYRVWLIATSLRRQGHPVSVICPAGLDHPAGAFHREGVLILRHPLKEAKSWLYYPVEYALALIRELALARRLWRRRPFEILHACNPPDLIWLLAALYKSRGVKYVFDHHDLCPELILAKKNAGKRSELSLPFRLLYGLMAFLERKAVSQAEISLSTNQSYRRIALTRDGADKERNFVVRSGIRQGRLLKQEDLSPLDLPRRPQIDLLYAGVMARQDGVDILLKAVAILKRSQARPVSLTLMGDGPEFISLKGLARELGIASQCQFLGFVKRQELMARLSQGGIGVTPDPYTPMNDASTMLKTLDYMACGLPQVLFDLKEHRETCQEAAVYAEASSPEALAQAILKVAVADGLGERLRDNALKRIAGLAWEQDGEPALLKAYESLYKN